jgi:type I restriction enzyme S subunit
VKNGWQQKKLEDICDVFADGDWIETKDQSSDGIRLIQTGNVGEGAFKDRGEKARYVSDATFQRLRCTEIFEGDCLISRLPEPVGRSCILPNTGERMITAVDCTIVRFSQSQMISRFFNFYSQSRNYLKAVDTETTGTTRKRISRSKLGQVPVPIPPIREQQHIVSILDNAFDAIATAKANTENNVQHARALFESDLQAIFTQRGKGWVEKTLADVSKVFGRGKSRHRPRNEPKLYGGKYPFVQTGDVRNAVDVIDSYSQTYSDVGLAQSKLWPAGTVCITIAANIAETAILGFDSCFPDSMIGVVPDERITSSAFLQYLLQSFKSHLQAQGKGSAQHNINLGTFEHQTFPFPSLTKQQAIINRLTGIRAQSERLISLYQKKLAALDALKKSLLHQAFNGQL